MNSLHEPFSVDSTLSNSGANLTQHLEDYLDNLCAPLIGIIPYEARHDFRVESRAHLEALMAEYQELQMTPQEALETAFHEFGDPWKVGRAFLREWVRKAPARARRTRTPAACVFAWFGLVTVYNLQIFERYALFMDRGPDSCYWLIAACLAPFFAGVLTGLTQPYPDGRAVICVQVGLLLFTLLLGLTLLPNLYLLDLAVLQLFWWLPVGYSTTMLVATLAQRLRRPRFLRPPASRRHAL